MMKKTLSSLILAAPAAFALNAAVAAAEITWDMPNEYPSTSIHGEGDQFFSKTLNEKTNGQIKIVHHFGGALGYKSRDQLDAVGDGAVPLANTFIPPLGGVEGLFLLSALPFAAVTHEEARALYEVAKPHYEKAFNRYNQKLLYSSPWPPSGLWGKKPFDSTEALHALKLRTYDVQGTRTFQAAGAAPIQLSWADVVPQLGTGGIDAVLTSAEAGLSARFHEHLTHFTEINYASPLNMVTINLTTWEKLSPELQAALQEAADAAEDYTWSSMKQRVEANYADAAKRGITISRNLDQSYLAQLTASGASSLERWKQDMGAEGGALIADYLQRLGR